MGYVLHPIPKGVWDSLTLEQKRALYQSGRARLTAIYERQGGAATASPAFLIFIVLLGVGLIGLARWVIG